MPELSDPRTDAIIGAAMDIQRQLGCGFDEPVYSQAIEIKLGDRGIPFVAHAYAI